MTPPGGDRLLLAGACVRAMAQSALRGRLARGRFPGGITALDFFGDADLEGEAVRIISVARDLGLPRTVADTGRAALAMSWESLAIAGGFENRPGLLRLLARRGRLLGSAPEAIRAVRDPATLFPWLADEGLPHARTRAGALMRPGGTTPRDAGLAPLATVPRGGRGWLLKRRRGAGGGGVRPARPGEIVPPGCHLQEYLRGRSGSAAFLADGREAVLLGVSEQIAGAAWLGADGFRHAGNLVDATDLARGPGRLLSDAGIGVARRIAGSLAARFGLRGLAGFDFIAVDGAPHLIEVNPRWTASMELIDEALGASLFDALILVAGGEDAGRAVRASLAARASGGASVVAAGSDGAPVVAGGARDARVIARGVLYAGEAMTAPPPAALATLGARDRPRRGELILPGQPVCTLAAAAATRSEALTRLRTIAATVRSLLAGTTMRVSGGASEIGGEGTRAVR